MLTRAGDAVGGEGGGEEGDGGAVGVAEEHGLLDAGGGHELGEDGGLVVEVAAGAGAGEGRGAAESLAVVDEAFAPGGGAEAVGEVAPGGDAAEGVVEEDDGGFGRGVGEADAPGGE